MRDPTPLLETLQFSERLCLSVRGSASQWEALPPCENPCLSMGGPAFLL